VYTFAGMKPLELQIHGVIFREFLILNFTIALIYKDIGEAEFLQMLISF